MTDKAQKLEMRLNQAKNNDLLMFEEFLGQTILFSHNEHKYPIYGTLEKIGDTFIKIKNARELDESINTILNASYNSLNEVFKQSEAIYNKKDISEAYKFSLP